MASIEEVHVTDDAEFTDWKTARDTLRDIRETERRDSRVVVALGKILIDKYSNKLGDEVWTVHEQLVMAALDIGDTRRAESSFGCLKKRFSNSKRVKKLEGLIMEGKEDFDEALEYYEGILKDDPTNTIISKRIVAIHKARGDTALAITKLTEILEITMADYESWSELASLYISQHQYDKAAFCLEELILSNPHNYIFHQRYAEVCYTQNTTESLEIARKHYATSLKLKPSNLRSLYGLYQTAVSLGKHLKKKEAKVRNDDIAQWCMSQLLETYQENCNMDQLKVLENFLKPSK